MLVVGLVAVGLGVGACGSDRATCTKIVKKSLACEQPSGVNMADLSDVLGERSCSDDDAAKKVASRAACLDETDCAKFEACLAKK